MSGDKKYLLAKKTLILYLIAGFCWIFFSDLIAKFLSIRIQDLFYLEIIKGFLFIIFSGILLFIYIQKQTIKLMELESRYEILFRNHKSIMLVIDPETGYIMDANKSAEEFYGYTLDEIKKLRIWDINILPEDEVKKRMEKAKEQKLNFFLFKHRLKNGEIRDVEVHSSPVTIGHKTFLYSVINDITQKIQNEDKLKNLLKMYETACKNLENLIDFSPLPIIAVNEDGIVKIWNKSAEKTFGWKKEEVLGKFNPIVPEEKKEEFFSLIRKTVDGEVLKEVEIERINKEGKYLKLRGFFSSMINTSGEKENLIAIFEDITEKKKMEEEILHIKKMETIGKLAAGISHDFNNMLTAIIGFASIIELKTRDNEEINNYAKQILSVSERATYLTKGLLTYSRKHPFSPKILNLNDLIKSSIGFLEKIIGENIKIKLNLDDKIKKINADPYQLEQIFINLLSNAKDAMPNGGTIIIETTNHYLDEKFINLHKYGEVGEYVKLSITDTGCGIADEIKEKVFDPFFTTKGESKSTGLGLSIVYGIVKKHNGYINFNSEINKGTTFNIYFPAVEDTHNVSYETHEEKKVIDISFKNLCVLVVDDDYLVLESLKVFLENLHCKVFLAKNATEAFDVFEKNSSSINLVIFDLMMPDENGVVLYEKLKKLKPDLKFIMISGYNVNVLKEIYNIPSNLPFIQKPIMPSALIETVKNIFP